MSEVLTRWGLASRLIGAVTDTGRVEVVYPGAQEINVSVAPLTDKPRCIQNPMKRRLPISQGKARPSLVLKTTFEILTWQSKIFLKMLSMSPSVEPIYRQYITTSAIALFGLLTLKEPVFSGYEVKKPASISILRCAAAAVVMSDGSKIMLFVGAADAVLQCARSIFAAGGTPLASRIV